MILTHSGAPTETQRLAAALSYAGADAVLTGAAACRLYGLHRVPPGNQIQLLVPACRQPATVRFVIIERTTRMPAPLSVQGWPVAPRVRAVLDLARRIRRLDDVRGLLAEAIQRGLCTVEDLSAELDTGSRAGSARPRRVLREVGAGPQSVAEIDGLRIARRSRLLPTLRWNVPIFDQHGRFIAIPDAWADDVGLAWEIDSYEFHLSPQHYDRTLRRHAKMVAAGIVVVHTTPRRLRTEPSQVLRELEAAYRQALLRPRPDVVIAAAA